MYPTQKGGADKKPGPHEECRVCLDYGEEVHRLAKNISRRRGGYLRKGAAGMANKLGKNVFKMSFELDFSRRQALCPRVTGGPRNLTFGEFP